MCGSKMPIIAAEDQNFLTHSGFDVTRIDHPPISVDARRGSWGRWNYSVG